MIDEMSSTLTLIAMILGLCFLFHPKMRNWSIWRATATPLASIIGSGFLVAAPIMHEVASNWAPVAMALLCAFTYLIGRVMRWNIQDLESLLEKKNPPVYFDRLNRMSDAVLAFAYVISVTFYLNLLSEFLLRGLKIDNSFLSQSITTSILASISVLGFFFGLKILERMEIFSVNLKLSIILAFIAALVLFNFQTPLEHFEFSLKQTKGLEGIPLLLGLLILGQGFETSRYLGEEYSTDIRTKSMRAAQIVSSIIYFVFVSLMISVFQHSPNVDTSETAIISLSEKLNPVLPIILIAAALASQFSAAVADTAGCGGLLEDITHRKLKAKWAYLILAATGILLTWMLNIYQIINYASKAFALYYLLQSLLFFSFEIKNKKRLIRLTLSAFICIACLAVLIFGKSVEGS